MPFEHHAACTCEQKMAVWKPHSTLSSRWRQPLIRRSPCAPGPNGRLHGVTDAAKSQQFWRVCNMCMQSNNNMLLYSLISSGWLTVWAALDTLKRKASLSGSGFVTSAICTSGPLHTLMLNTVVLYCIGSIKMPFHPLSDTSPFPPWNPVFLNVIMWA